jgi:succinate dehydrogenase / fumarate reductase membrane anchor subunit
MADARNAPHIDMLRSPLGRARGLGSAREGAKHWWAQQLTSIALVPLTLWFIWSILRLSGAAQADVAEWLSSPVRLSLMMALIMATFHHLRLGLQVVIEDYVHHEALKLAAVLAVNAACILLGLICAVSALTLGLST